MGSIVNIIAVVIAIVAVLAAVGHGAYLAMLNSAANKRAGGAPVAKWVQSRWPIVAGTTVVAALAWLMTSADSIPVDILAMLVAGTSGAVATRALRQTQERYRIGG